MGRGKSVLEHPDKATIDKMLLSGWTISKVHEWLINHDKKEVSAQTLLQYRDNYIDPKLVLPPSIYHKRIKLLDCQVDALQELYNLMEIQKRRVGNFLEIEDIEQIANPDIRKELELLKDTIVKTIQLEMEMGIRDKRAIEIIEKKFDMVELLKEYLNMKQSWEGVIEK